MLFRESARGIAGIGLAVGRTVVAMVIAEFFMSISGLG
jgi:hypothetical protein